MSSEHIVARQSASTCTATNFCWVMSRDTDASATAPGAAGSGISLCRRICGRIASISSPVDPLPAAAWTKAPSLTTARILGSGWTGQLVARGNAPTASAGLAGCTPHRFAASADPTRCRRPERSFGSAERAPSRELAPR